MERKREVKACAGQRERKKEGRERTAEWEENINIVYNCSGKSEKCEGNR